jgi:hypothetical protein
MVGILFGIFLVLHGLVHLLYFGQSARYFELQPGMAWPDKSWAFSRLLGNGATRILASIACVLAALGFVAGGLGIFLSQAWWHTAIVGTAAFSAVIFILFWDGVVQKLDNKGGIGILIDLAVLSALLVLHWPAMGF